MSTMLIRCNLLLVFIYSALANNVYFNGVLDESNKSFSLWPSVHNAVKYMRLRREAIPEISTLVAEGGVLNTISNVTAVPPLKVSQPQVKIEKNSTKLESHVNENKSPKGSVIKNVTSAPKNTSNTSSTNSTSTNTTSIEKITMKNVDLKNPGVLKRGFIVFGGFALMAVAYLIFYRYKNKNNETSSSHGKSDANQFKYGVLHSDDRRDNLELSRVPLTMESDDDDDDDLEIFDLEQKKKSLSYVNLQKNDEDIVLSPSGDVDNDRNNLLLDIDDRNSDVLINWSNNGNKSVL